MKGFKEFLLQGNIVDLAVAVIIGAAFGDVVKSFTTMLMDLIGKIFATPNFSGFTPGGVHVGVFITAVISFIILAAVVYFAIVRPVTALQDRLKKDDPAAALTTDELLVQIRDLLAANNAK